MQRDLRIDTLRGLMLVIMLITHIRWFAFPIALAIYQPIGFVTAAEGFVFLSGLVAGIVYTRTRLIKGNSALWIRAFTRARDIYLYHMFVFVALLIISTQSAQISESWARMATPLFFQQKFTALKLGAILLFQPILLDILPMYCVFVIATPFLINQITHRRGHWVLLLSTAMWLSAQLGLTGKISGLISYYLPIKMGFFDILAWQLLFVTGLIVGFWQYTRTKPLLSSNYRIILFITSAVIASILFIQRLGLKFDFYFIPNVKILTDKFSLAPLRLLNFMVVAYLTSVITTRFKNLFTWRWLSFLGQHSLQVFSFHVLLVYALRTFHDQLVLMNEALKTFIVIALVLSLSIPAYIHMQYRQWKYGVTKITDKK